VFASRESRRGSAGLVDVAFTDRHGGSSPPPFESFDLGARGPDRSIELKANFELLARELGVRTIATMRQGHTASVAVVTSSTSEPARCDALVTRKRGVALCVRVADCVPVVLADTETGVVAVAHAGRVGVAAGIVAATLETMRKLGAQLIEAWVGPYVCGSCYEVPASMRADVASSAPVAFACTTSGTPSLDLGAAATAQLLAAGCTVNDRSRCTRESADLYSYRRDGARSGRSAGVVVLTERDG
jgi:purine-nucleoside/S-methyl-5'-thioadenosine phosphorylase / adenosine deaminase